MILPELAAGLVPAFHGLHLFVEHRAIVQSHPARSAAPFGRRCPVDRPAVGTLVVYCPAAGKQAVYNLVASCPAVGKLVEYFPVAGKRVACNPAVDKRFADCPAVDRPVALMGRTLGRILPGVAVVESHPAEWFLD